MKKVALILALPLALASCNWLNNPTTQFDISGSMNGATPSGGEIKLALVGASLSFNPIQNFDVAQINLANSKFTLDLPNQPTGLAGIYEVIAYVDANKNGKYDVGETRTKPNAANTLIYTAGTHKWVRGSTVIRENDASVNRINNYDLSW